MRLDQMSGAMAQAAGRLDAAGGALLQVDPGATAFGADAPGRLGELGRMLHNRLTAALTDRAREAAAHSARLADTADLLGTVLGRYRDTDDAAGSRHEPEES